VLKKEIIRNDKHAVLPLNPGPVSLNLYTIDLQVVVAIVLLKLPHP
jgi:hypothetical protein